MENIVCVCRFAEILLECGFVKEHYTATPPAGRLDYGFISAQLLWLLLFVDVDVAVTVDVATTTTAAAAAGENLSPSN